MAKVKTNSKSMLIGVIYLLVVILILIFLFVNNKGILKYMDVRQRVKNLEGEIDTSEQKINKIEAEIDSLKTDKFKIEKTAREKYNMKRPHEKGLEVKVKKNGKSE